MGIALEAYGTAGMKTVKQDLAVLFFNANKKTALLRGGLR